MKNCLSSKSALFVLLSLLLSLPLPLFANVATPKIQAQTVNAVGNSADQQKLDDLQRKIAQLRKQKQDINDAIQAEKNKQGGYSNEIRLINQEKSLIESEIKEKELVIEELNLQISILGKTILDTQQVIVETRAEVEKLEVEADKQLSEMYLDIKTNNNSLSLIFSDGSKNLVKTGLYQKSIQEDTNNSLKQLQEKSDKLKQDQAKLEADKVKVETDKAEINVEKSALDVKRNELQAKTNRLWALYNEAQKSIQQSNAVRQALSAEESKLLAEQELLQQRVFNNVREINNGTYVVKGTIIGYQGLTGLTTGYHLHFGVQVNGTSQNPCGYLPGGVVSGCAGDGQLAWPLKGSFYYTSGYGYRDLGGNKSFHAAIDIAHPIQNAPIYAAHDGWYKRGFEPCNPSYWLCKGGGANYVILCENKANCNAGLKTLYWHLK